MSRVSKKNKYKVELVPSNYQTTHNFGLLYVKAFKEGYVFYI